MDKIVLILFILRIVVAAVAAVFLALNIYDVCLSHDRDSLLLSILWAAILIFCIASIFWVRKGRKESS